MYKGNQSKGHFCLPGFPANPDGLFDLNLVKQRGNSGGRRRRTAGQSYPEHADMGGEAVVERQVASQLLHFRTVAHLQAQLS
jgi:hypothetical protein